MAFWAPEQEPEKLNRTLTGLQKEIDSLKTVAESKKDTLYPFNPNYISDYKGYVLGMTVEEIDRLHEYRNTGKFVNTVSEFGEVTGVSDSLLLTISPYFRFPAFVKKEIRTRADTPAEHDGRNSKKDLNKAVAADFRLVRGIGEKLSARIVKYRDLLGGFSVNDQLYEVYGLDSAVVKRALRYFDVVKQPETEKLDINSASLDQLASLVYLSREEAKKIIAYRSEVHEIDSLGELTKLKKFSVEKIDRIRLYLTVE